MPDGPTPEDGDASRVVVTGTPGTGKTSAVERVDTDLRTIHLNEWVAERDLYQGHDETRDTRVVDLEAVRERVPDDDYLVESHLAHHLPADRVVVLRCHPATVRERLLDRGESAETAAENADSEALDVILAEAVDRHGEDRVYEVETTDRDPAAVARAIEAVVAGEREPAVGTVSYVEYLA